MTDTDLIARGVSKQIGAAVIVSEVDLTLKPGEITALLGPSGAGKSTLLRLLAGLDDLSAGEVSIAGEVLSRKGETTPPERRRTGLVFQDFALFPHMTALENVGFGLPHLSKSDRQATALRWLQRMQLGERANAYPAQLSGGEQQRVAIARALAPNPAAILMDEPFSGLDPALRGGVAERTLAVIREAQVPALWVTHDPEEAMGLADTIAIMQAGRLIQFGTPEAVYRYPVSLGAAEAMGPINVIQSPTQGEPVLVRPEDLILDEGGDLEAEMVSSVFTGPAIKVFAWLGDIRLLALIPRGTPLPGAGATIRFSIATENGHNPIEES